MQFLNDKERQDGKKQEHASGKEKSAYAQQYVISGEKGFLRSLVWKTLGCHGRCLGGLRHGGRVYLGGAGVTRQLGRLTGRRGGSGIDTMDTPRFFCGLLLLGVCMLTWGCAEKKENFMATGQGLQARTLYGPAEAEYRRAIKEDPTNAEAHYRLGSLANQLGNTVGAEKEYRAALQVNATHPAAQSALADILINRGAAARRQGKGDDARRELEEAVKVYPGSSTAHLELGVTYEEAGQIEKAVQEYQAAVKADAGNVAARLRLGQGYNAQKQYKPAAAAFETVLAGNPDEAEAHAGLGVAYFHLGKPDQAKKAFEQAVRKHLVAGRRDLARQVKSEADRLMPGGK